MSDDTTDNPFDSDGKRNPRPAGPDHQVVEVKGREGKYRRQPCAGCPWRADNTGNFSAEAFRLSADTAYDMSQHSFGCHESGAQHSQTCAGFLLRGAAHNLAVRMGFIEGHLKDDVTDGGHELYEDYTQMAIANGVDPDDPVLLPCRGPNDYND